MHILKLTHEIIYVWISDVIVAVILYIECLHTVLRVFPAAKKGGVASHKLACFSMHPFASTKHRRCRPPKMQYIYLYMNTGLCDTVTADSCVTCADIRLLEEEAYV